MCRVLQVGDDRRQNFEGWDLVNRLDLMRIKHAVEDVLMHVFSKNAHSLDTSIEGLQLFHYPVLCIHAGQLTRITSRSTTTKYLEVESVAHYLTKALDSLRQTRLQSRGAGLPFSVVFAVLGCDRAAETTGADSPFVEAKPAGSAHLGRVGIRSGLP